MSGKSKNGWERTVAGVTWADVWHWADEIRDAFGLHVSVSLYPSLVGKKQPYGTIAVSLSAVIEGVGMQVRHHKWVALPEPGRVSAEQLALQMLVSLHQQLDTLSYEAEREAVRLGLMF